MDELVISERIMSEKEINYHRLSSLVRWFDNYFDKQFTQSQWQDDFTLSHDDYFDKNYENLDELKTQAKVVRDEIRALREFFSKKESTINSTEVDYDGSGI